MAKLIKETPILTGKDAVNFYEQMKVNSTKKVSESELNRIIKNSNRLKSISDGHILR